MGNKEKTSTDFVAEAEKIINAKFYNDYAPRIHVIKKRSAFDITLNVCTMVGCLFLALALIVLR